MSGAEARRLRVWCNSSDENYAQLNQALIIRMWCDEADQLHYRPSEIDTGVLDGWDEQLIAGVGLACDKHSGFSRSAYNVEQISGTAKNS